MPVQPSRRAFLGTLASGLAAGMAGCSAPGDLCLGGLSARRADSDEPPGTVIGPLPFGEPPTEGVEPMASYVVDCGAIDHDERLYTRPQWLSVWNVGSNAQEIGYALTTARRESALIDETRTFAPAELVLFQLREADHYRLRVEQGERRATVDVERRRFDCNDGQTQVRVPSEGPIDDESQSTAQGCSLLPL